MGSLHDQESAVADLLEVLDEHRANCQRLGKYMEADIARKRIDELLDAILDYGTIQAGGGAGAQGSTTPAW